MIERISKWGMAWTTLIGVLVIVGVGVAATQDTNEAESARWSRACVFPIGGWTEIDCSAAAADNGTALTAWTRYITQCTQDSYMAWGDATGDDADSSDGYLPAGEWVEFLTTDDVKWVSCESSTNAGKCYYIECQ